MDQTEQLTITLYAYANIVEEYLQIEKSLLACKTKTHLQELIAKHDIVIRPIDFGSLSLVELIDYILSDFRAEVTECTHSVFDKIKIV